MTGKVPDSDRAQMPAMRSANARCDGGRSSGGGGASDQALQARVQVGDAGQVVQHALVNTQRAGGQRVARADLDETPAAQRRGWA